MKTMDDQLKRLYHLQAQIDFRNKELEALEKEKGELLQMVAVECCATKKKLAFPLQEENKTVVISRRDYKVFTPDVQLLLDNEKVRYEGEIATFKAETKSNEAAIKRDAEKAKKVKLDIRYYLKIEDGIKEVDTDDHD